MCSVAGLQESRIRGNWIIGIAFGIFILLAACSSPGGSAPTPSPGGAAPSPPPKVGTTPTKEIATPPAATQGSTAAVTDGEIRVTLKNNTFPEEIRVKVGAKVVFVITNKGDETHSFEFPDLGVYKEIAPGQTLRIEWLVPNKPGKWDMGCFLTDPPGVHDNMEGTLIIE